MRGDPHQLSNGGDERIRMNVVHEGVEKCRPQMVDADQKDLQEELQCINVSLLCKFFS